MRLFDWCKKITKTKDFNIKDLKDFFRKENMSKKKIIILVSAVLVLLLTIFLVVGSTTKGNDAKKSYVESQAVRMDITETIEQSGVVEPLERYEITALVKGEIIESPFEEGDFVNEGDTLYQIDDEDAQLSMERAQMSLDEANENVSKLNIYAPASGRLTDFSLEMGDSVGNGLVGKIVNSDILTVDIPFSTLNFEKISVGDKVTITSALYMTSLPGIVTHKYYANTATGADGSILRNIEIEIDNPGALAENTTFAATVHTKTGDVSSSGSGIIDSGSVSEVRAEVSGTVSYIAVKDGDYVSKGQLIASLKNNSLVNSQKSSILNLRSNQKTLDNYRITAPISGTIITKNSKAGDKIDNSNSQTVMMVVADMSKMKFTITVDELDIADIKLGQTAVVDADAIPNTTFDAHVTSISSEGVSSGDGVTTFTVELTIDEPGELKSGMNVNANILINEAKDVIAIPEEALMGISGSRASVLVKSSNNSKNKEDNKDINMMQGEEGAPKQEKAPDVSNNKANAQNFGNVAGGTRGNLPKGYEIRMVEIGISNGTFVEIKSGIEEGESITYIPSSGGLENPFFTMMGQMHSNMGGGMPAGRMPSGTGQRSGAMGR